MLPSKLAACLHRHTRPVAAARCDATDGYTPRSAGPANTPRRLDFGSPGLGYHGHPDQLLRRIQPCRDRRVAAGYAVERGSRRAGIVSASEEHTLRRKTAFAERFPQRAGKAVVEVKILRSASLASGREGLARLIEGMDFGNGLVFCSSNLFAPGVLMRRVRDLFIPHESTHLSL